MPVKHIEKRLADQQDRAVRAEAERTRRASGIHLSEWAKPEYKNVPVTRGEFLAILAHYERRRAEASPWGRIKEFCRFGWLPRWPRDLPWRGIKPVPPESPARHGARP